VAWHGLLSTAGEFGIKALADQIRKAPLKGDKSEPGQEPEAGCPACSVHRELAEAERLMAGVLRSWQGDEPAPAERRAVVLLVEGNLTAAKTRLKEVHAERPDIAAALKDLTRCVDAASAELPNRANTTRGDWERGHQAVFKCWEMADTFAGAWFKRPDPGTAALQASEDDELVLKVKRLSPEDRKKLLDILGE
jgi:hypothetical protein